MGAQKNILRVIMKVAKKTLITRLSAGMAAALVLGSQIFAPQALAADKLDIDKLPVVSQLSM